MAHRTHSRGFTILELGIALLLVAGLLAVLVPTLSTARQTAHRQQCASHQREIGAAWFAYLGDHNDEFPLIVDQPGWMYAGMRFSAADGAAFADVKRPLNVYLNLPRTREFSEVVCCCPADRGITDATAGLGTGSRTAFRSFGTSYRANSALIGPGRAANRSAGGVLLSSDALETVDNESTPATMPDEPLQGLLRTSIITAPSRLLMMGDPVWYERAEETGRLANWHGENGAGNLLFLDGSVRFQVVKPRKIVGPIVFEPQFEYANPTRGAKSQ